MLSGGEAGKTQYLGQTQAF